MSTKNSGYTAAGQVIQRQATNPLVEQKRFLDARVDALSKWVREGVRADALIRFALLDMQQQPKLAACDPLSIYLGLLACAQTGLEPGALRGEAYLVPFAGRATFIAGYRGLIKQVRRSREVQNLTANVVYERDQFDLVLGTTQAVTHRPERGDRGAIVGAYAVALLTGGACEVEWMSLAELEKVKAVATARSKSPAWSSWESEMFRKAPIRRLCKRLPTGSDYIIAQALDQAGESGSSASEILDVLTEGAASEAQAQAGRAPIIEIPPIGKDEAAEILAAEGKQS